MTTLVFRRRGAGAIVCAAVWLWTASALGQQPPNRPLERRPAGASQLPGQLARQPYRAPGTNGPSNRPPTPADAIRVVEASLAALEPVADYSCVLIKRERIAGRLTHAERLAIKLRHDPFSVYVNYLAPDKVKGQEAIYVHGHNDNRLLAHPNGLKGRLVGTFKLDPQGKMAMEGNRYPITDLGVKRMAESWLEEARRDVQFVRCSAKIIPGAKVNERPCTCVELTRLEHHHDSPFRITRLFIDAELRLPVRYEAYEWSAQPGGEPELAEEYTYLQFQPNRRFSDLDFDVQNPEYKFK
ncbi:MAG TPA: DUF1571 domain-containing protein [Pirellulales bacterium]|nr:DUF1571 domain-containing protein [Pirellulales bacterium]